MGGEECLATPRVGRSRKGLASESGGGVCQQGKRQADKECHPDAERKGWPTDDPAGDPAPEPAGGLARNRDAWPEDGLAEDGEQRGEQGEIGEECHGDADGEGRTEPLIEPEGGDHHRRKGGDDDEPGERDRLAHLGEGEGHGVERCPPAPDLLAHPKDEEEPVVGSCAEQDHYEEDRGQVGHLYAQTGRCGDDRLYCDERHSGGQ